MAASSSVRIFKWRQGNRWNDIELHQRANTICDARPDIGMSNEQLKSVTWNGLDVGGHWEYDWVQGVPADDDGAGAADGFGKWFIRFHCKGEVTKETHHVFKQVSRTSVYESGPTSSHDTILLVPVEYQSADSIVVAPGSAV